MIKAALVAFAKFLEMHGFTTRRLVERGELIGGREFVIRSDDLTHDGMAMIRAAFGSWEKKGYGIPEDSTVVTNLDALKGKPITEAMRWEDTDWELFAGPGPDVTKDEIRIVPFGTLLGVDASLEPVVNLAVGKGLWRDPVDLNWHSWESRKS